MLTKEKIRKTIDTMPEILSLDEVIEKLILLEKIEEGMKDADEGRVYSTEEVKRRLNGWLK